MAVEPTTQAFLGQTLRSKATFSDEVGAPWTPTSVTAHVRKPGGEQEDLDTPTTEVDDDGLTVATASYLTDADNDPEGLYAVVFTGTLDGVSVVARKVYDVQRP